MPELIFREAGYDDMYEVMDIRNSGRVNMTHHTEIITPEQQYDWWTTKDNNRYTIWLVLTPELMIDSHDRIVTTGEEIIIGFCMIRYMDDGMYWGTLAVYPDWQGVGYGTEIYKFMTQQVDVLWIEIKTTNMPSIRAAQKAGFEIYFQNSEIVTMVSR